MDSKARQRRVTAEMQRQGLDAFVISHLPNVMYLTGFSGSAGVLALAKGKSAFFTDGRYREQARAEVDGSRVVVAKGPALVAASQWIADVGVANVGIEAEHLTVSAASALRKQMRSVRQKPTTGLVERLRMIKSAGEVARLRAAVALGDTLMNVARKCLRPGVVEAEVAAEMEYAAKNGGASAMSFETIVAAGERSALPHGKASNARIPKRGFVVLDFGVVLEHYCSDMTRTVYVGKPSQEDRELYEAVREAQQAAVEAVRPGVQVGEVDQAARSVLQKAGLARYFTHSTGHGVGLEIHEMPRVAAGVKDVLEPGMVITIEPGAYLPGRGGVRIEDMVVVTDGGSEVLTQTPKELIVV